MKRFISLLSGLAIVAATSTAQAQIDWATGAPGGTTGGSVQFGAEVLANDAGDNAFFLATGIGAAQVAPTSGEDYTVAAWIKSEEAEPSNTALARNNRWWIGTGNQGLHLGIQDDTNDDIDVVTPSGLASAHWSNDSAGSTSIEVNTWVHVTHVYRAGVQEIYLNGVLNGTTVNGAPNMDGTDLQIGSRNGELGPGWNGCIDDVAIFTSALSATDIATLAGDASQAVTLGAAAYYNFEDDQTGSTALNLVDVTASGLVGFDGVTPALQELSGIGAELPPPPPVATWAAGAPDGTTGGSLLFDGEAEQFASTGMARIKSAATEVVVPLAQTIQSLHGSTQPVQMQTETPKTTIGGWALVTKGFTLVSLITINFDMVTGLLTIAVTQWWQPILGFTQPTFLMQMAEPQSKRWKMSLA